MSEHFVQNNVNARIARKLVFTAPSQAQIAQIQLGALEKHSVLIRTEFSGISRGTESLVFQGRIPHGEWNAMRCPYQEGEFSFPVSYGYSLVGHVIETGDAVTRVKTGDQVFVLHPHQDKILASEQDCNPLPDGLPGQRAVLSANAETALNAIWDSELASVDKVAVFGAGVVGLLVAAFANSRTDGRVTIIEQLEERRAIAEKLGLRFVGPGDQAAGEERYDCVFNTTASGHALQRAIDICSFEGRIVEVSWYGNKPVELSLGGRFHSQRLKIISSQVGHVSKNKRASVNHADRMKMAMVELLDPQFDLLLEQPVPFSTLPEQVTGMLGDNAKALCQVIDYTEN